MQNTRSVVISLGGSILAPTGPDAAFIRDFVARMNSLLEADPGLRIVFVVGGGGPARSWQNACREAAPATPDQELDWIGIMATRLNAQLLKAAFGPACKNPVVIDPSQPASFDGRVLVGAGWKPGFSTDFDAVLLAGQFGADTVINLSNIAQVYTADPKADPNAKPIERIGWKEFKAIVGDDWVPGKNLPFDPVATRKAAEMGLRVIAADGRNLDNVAAILQGRPFFGTTIGPD